MSISIVTKFLGPTNYRGARVSAQVSDYGSELERRYARERGKGGRLVVDWDHGLSLDANHMRAAMALAKRLGWAGDWIGGDAPGSAGYVFVRPDYGLAFTIEEEARP